MQRRRFIAAAGTALAVAGCTDDGGDESGNGNGDDTAGSLDVESPASPEEAVELWYATAYETSSVDEYEEKRNTLAHTEGIYYPVEIQESGGGEDNGEKADYEYEGVEIGSTEQIEEISQQNTPQIAGRIEDETLREELVNEGGLTKVEANPQFSGDDAPPTRTFDNFVAKEDGEWRILA